MERRVSGVLVLAAVVAFGCGPGTTPPTDVATEDAAPTPPTVLGAWRSMTPARELVERGIAYADQRLDLQPGGNASLFQELIAAHGPPAAPEVRGCDLLVGSVTGTWTMTGAMLTLTFPTGTATRTACDDPQQNFATRPFAPLPEPTQYDVVLTPRGDMVLTRVGAPDSATVYSRP